MSISAAGTKAADASSLEVFVPEDSEFDLQSFLHTASIKKRGSEGQPPLLTIRQRDVLYFDESIPIYLSLRTNHAEISQLVSYISRLRVTLEIVAFTPRPSSEHGRHAIQHSTLSPNHEIIWSEAVDTAQGPTIVVRREQCIEAIWKITVLISRPRVRLSCPAIAFRPSASFSRSPTSRNSATQDRYLSSGIPTSVNLLESIKDEPSLGGIIPRLPALRLSRINTTGSGASLTEEVINATPKGHYRVIPAITARVRYSRANGVTAKPTIMASLDVETAALFNYDVRIESIRMSLSEGSIEDLSHGITPILPMNCRPRDSPTFLFRLVSSILLSEAGNPHSNSRTLDVLIIATVLGVDRCRPRIEMHWRTGVDFSTSLNPIFGAPSQPLQRSKRPANISMAHIVSKEIGTAGLSQDTHDNAHKQERATLTSDLGVSVTFTAPAKITVGEIFCWDIFVVNRSSRPRKLSISIVPKRKKANIREHLSKPSNSSMGGRNDPAIAESVMEENNLYAAHRNSSKDAVQVISLSNDLKIGPLASGSCFNGELKFLPLAKGVLQVEAVRVLDAGTNESIDVRDLPEVIAVENATGKLTGPIRISKRLL